MFITLLLVSIVALVLGYTTTDEHYSYVGLFFLFLLGIYLVTGQVTYPSGKTTITNYTYNGTSITSTTATETTALSSYNDQYANWFGFLLSVSAGFGMALSLYNYRIRKKENE